VHFYVQSYTCSESVKLSASVCPFKSNTLIKTLEFFEGSSLNLTLKVCAENVESFQFRFKFGQRVDNCALRPLQPTILSREQQKKILIGIYEVYFVPLMQCFMKTQLRIFPMHRYTQPYSSNSHANRDILIVSVRRQCVPWYCRLREYFAPLRDDG